VLALGALLLLAPVLAAPGSKSLHGPGRPLLSYFAFLGIGYLFVETALIQKFILPRAPPWRPSWARSSSVPAAEA